MQPCPGPGGKWRISTEGGREPLWNRNGRELFYRSGDNLVALTAQKYVRMEYARKASRAKVSHSFSLPDEVEDLLAKLIVRGVNRQGCRLVIVSGEAQKSRTL